MFYLFVHSDIEPLYSYSVLTKFKSIEPSVKPILLLNNRNRAITLLRAKYCIALSLKIKIYSKITYNVIKCKRTMCYFRKYRKRVFKIFLFLLDLWRPDRVCIRNRTDRMLSFSITIFIPFTIKYEFWRFYLSRLTNLHDVFIFRYSRFDSGFFFFFSFRGPKRSFNPLPPVCTPH